MAFRHASSKLRSNKSLAIRVFENASSSSVISIEEEDGILMFQSLGSELQEDDDVVRAFVAVRWRHAQAGIWPNNPGTKQIFQDDPIFSAC